VFLPDDPHLLPVAVVGEGEGDIASGAKKVSSDLAQHVGVLESNLGHKFTGGEITPALYLKQVTTGKNKGPGSLKSFSKSLAIHVTLQEKYGGT